MEIEKDGRKQEYEYRDKKDNIEIRKIVIARTDLQRVQRSKLSIRRLLSTTVGLKNSSVYLYVSLRAYKHIMYFALCTES